MCRVPTLWRLGSEKALLDDVHPLTCDVPGAGTGTQSGLPARFRGLSSTEYEHGLSQKKIRTRVHPRTLASLSYHDQTRPSTFLEAGGRCRQSYPSGYHHAPYTTPSPLPLSFGADRARQGSFLSGSVSPEDDLSSRPSRSEIGSKQRTFTNGSLGIHWVATSMSVRT